MAVDVCSEISSLVSSPRISFSYDLNQTDVLPVECHHRRSDALLLDFNTDFDFCITNNSFSQEISSADELFSNGKILPTQIKKVNPTTKKTVLHRPQSILAQTPPPKISQITLKCENANEGAKKKRLKEFLFEDTEEEKPTSKSFWQFKRSASLNCDDGRSKGLIRSLQILARSNSTGSAPNSKQAVLQKVTSRKNSQKQSSFVSTNSQSLPSSGGNHQIHNPSTRPSLKKCRSYNYGVSISPVLNIPPAYISKGTANLFGFGSFFCNGKSKKKKK